MDLRSQIVGTVLGQTDALFTLWRRYRDYGHALYARRKTFHAVGVPWNAARFGDEISRMSSSRMLSEMRLEGLMTAGNRSGSRTTHAKLTTAGDLWARKSMGLPSLASSYPINDLLYGLREHPDGVDTADGLAWTRETMLAATDYGQADTDAKLQCLSEQIQPAISNGLIDSLADVHGRGWYSLLPAGIEIAEKRLQIKSPAAPSKKLNFKSDLWDAYLDALESEKAAIQATPRTNELGRLAMSCSPETRGCIAARSPAATLARV